MQLKNVVEAGLQHNHKAQERILARKLLKQEVTPHTFAHVFNRVYAEMGYGKSPPLSKKDWGMLKHFLASLQKTDWNKDQIIDFIHKYIERWNKDLAGKEVSTLQFKKITLPIRPSVRVLFIAKVDILAILYEDKRLQAFNDEEGDDGFLPSL